MYWEEIWPGAWVLLDKWERPHAYIITLPFKREVFIFPNWMDRDEVLIVVAKKKVEGLNVSYENILTTKVPSDFLKKLQKKEEALEALSALAGT